MMYRGARPCIALKVISKSLKSILDLTGSQCPCGEDGSCMVLSLVTCYKSVSFAQAGDERWPLVFEIADFLLYRL